MIFVLILVLLVLFGIVFLMQPKFGKQPSGTYLSQMERSLHYNREKAAFENLSETPQLTEGATFGTVLKQFLLEKNPRSKPKSPLPTIKTDLLALSADEDVLIWFGHSSYFMQLNGKKVLVDPVFCGTASPVPFSIKAFKGSDIYDAKDLPDVDYLFISHDHWDHMDFKTLKALRNKVGRVICGLGVAAHLMYWGYKKQIITELDWDKNIILDAVFEVHTVTARHFSGRRFKKKGTLWTSFILKTPSYQVFIGGDSGYDTHFKTMGEKYGPFDLAILENGQYDDNWKYIHMHPHEVLQAAKDLKAKKLLPVHSAKFALANHAWDAPLKTITELHTDPDLQILTPKIGEKVNFKLTKQQFQKWWVGVD